MKVTDFADTQMGRVAQHGTRCIGSCHAATALREDWRQQLKQYREQFGFQYVRFHGILNDDISVCLCAHDGTLEALASGPKTVFRYKGNITPPASYDKWAALVSELAEHLVSRYGVEEVRTWYFEVWNEPISLLQTRRGRWGISGYPLLYEEKMPIIMNKGAHGTLYADRPAHRIVACPIRLWRIRALAPCLRAHSR